MLIENTLKLQNNQNVDELNSLPKSKKWTGCKFDTMLAALYKGGYRKKLHNSQSEKN